MDRSVTMMCRWSLLIGLSQALVLTSCRSDEAPVLVPDPRPRVSDVASSSGSDAAAGAVASALPIAARAPIERGLAAYEEVRLLLARDTNAGVGAAGARLMQAMHEAHAALVADVSAPVTERVVAVAEAARGLADGRDLAALRAAFGRVSAAVIALLELAPELREGRWMFTCPMAGDVFPRWVQATPRIDNPLQGAAMSTCGEAVGW